MWMGALLVAAGARSVGLDRRSLGTWTKLPEKESRPCAGWNRRERQVVAPRRRATRTIPLEKKPSLD